MPIMTTQTVPTQTDLELEQIKQNIKIMSDFVNKLTTKLSRYFGDLDQHYASYLKHLNSSTSATTSTSKPGYSFKYVDSEYQKLTKKLHKIIESIGNDFLEIHNVANEIANVYEKIKSLKDEIEISKKLPDSLDKMTFINRLNSKYIKKVMEYNKLVAAFNSYGSKLTSTQLYLNNDMIIYSPNSSNKKYSLSIKRIIEWFKNLASPEGVSLLRGEIIDRMTKNYATDLNTLINTPPLSSVSVMDPYSMSQNKTVNQSSSTLKDVNNSDKNTPLLDASFERLSKRPRFTGTPQVGTPSTSTGMPMPDYKSPVIPNVNQVIDEEPEDDDSDVDM